MNKYRLILLVDMPRETRHERKIDRAFQEWLFSNGYTLLQAGVYTRLANGQKQADAYALRVRANAPELGTVRVLALTERQFAAGALVSGASSTQEIEIGAKLDIFL